MVTFDNSTPGAGRRLANDADLVADLDNRLRKIDRLLAVAAEQSLVVTQGSKVLAEFARQAQAKLATAADAVADARLDEIADLLRHQTPARQQALMETLEGVTDNA